jgi:hypothetical protein
LALARYERLEHPGASDALDALGSVFTVSIAADRATPKQAADEWDDIVVSARSLVASTASTAPRWEERRTGDPSTNGHASSDGSDPYEDVPPPTDDDAPTVKRAPGRPAVATELVALAESRYRFAQADDGRPFAVPLDGSFSQDCTALVAVTVDHPRHVDVVELWEPPIGGTEYRVPVADVEEAIREACRRWTVREIVADPFRWTRSLQALEAEGLPVVEFPQSPARMTPATTRLFEAVVNDQVTHSGDLRLARHVGNCTLREDSRGTRLAKTSKHSTRRIDLAVAAVMAHDRASRVEPPKPKRVPLIAWL